MNCQFAILEHEALLHIVGPDTLKFLQGQTSCDTRKIDSHHALPGVFCTPQGRVVCDFLLCELGPDHFALRMRRDIRARSSATFGKYIIFSKAKLEDTREDWVALGVWGKDSAQALLKLFGEVPSERHGAAVGDSFALVQVDDQGLRFECYLHESKLQERLSEMHGVMQTGTEAEWQALQICSGIVRVEAATVEEYVPQTLNYDLTGHISFKKGCYTGQEVVARLHYLGKSKRRTYMATLPEDANCTVGDPVIEAASKRNVGAVVNCCTALGKSLLLLAVTTDSVANGLHLGDGGPRFELGEQPYALETP